MKDNDFDTESLSDEIGVEEYAVKKWVNGIHYPSVENLILLADTFECSTDYLLGLSDSFNPDCDDDEDDDEDDDDDNSDNDSDDDGDDGDDGDSVTYYSSPFKKLLIGTGITLLLLLIIPSCLSC